MPSFAHSAGIAFFDTLIDPFSYVVPGTHLCHDPAGFERIYFQRVLFGHTNLSEQRAVGVLAIRDDRLGDAPAQLFNDDLAPPLALGPFLVGGTAKRDSLVCSGWPGAGHGMA